MLNLTSPLGLNQTTYNIKVPFFESRKNDEAMEKELYGMLEKFNSIPYKDMEAPPLVDTLPDGYVYVLAANNTSVSSLRLSMILAVNDNINEHYHRQNGFTRLADTSQTGAFMLSQVEDHFTLSSRARLSSAADKMHDDLRKSEKDSTLSTRSLQRSTASEALS